jgi:hypothetical protein
MVGMGVEVETKSMVAHDRCRNPSLGSRLRQGGCKVAGL